MRRRTILVAVLIGLAILLAGVFAWSSDPAKVSAGKAGGGPTASPTAGSPTSASPSPKASPTTTKPTPSATPTKKPAPPAKPPTGTRPPGSGHGPGGSLIYTGSTGVALTFDDGPDRTYTPQILDLLKKYKIHATFCVIGKKARDNPDLIRRIVSEGHTLCNHSWAHDLHLGDNVEGHIRADMQMTLDAIHAAVPGVKVSYFRAPGGNFTTQMVAIAASLGMKSIYWQVDPRDWDTATYGTGSSMAAHIISVVESHVRQGGIILSHDAGPRSGTVLAYQTLIPWLQKHGYKLIGLPI